MWAPRDLEHQGNGRQFLRFEQTSEFEQGRRVRNGLAIEVNSNKTSDCLAVVERIFDAFVRQAKHCRATYMRSMPASPIGGHPAPAALG
jgi:hypothetical protein